MSSATGGGSPNQRSRTIMDAFFGSFQYRCRNGAAGTVDIRQAPADRRGIETKSEPYIDRDTGYALVGDVRLDDREALCGVLGVSGSVGAALDDRALILRAWMRWGRECPNHLLGDYAFAVWDARTSSLFCVRDHVGCRPFYYALTSDRFIFANTIEAILATPGVSDALDERMVATYLSRGPIGDNAHTFFRAVRNLLPGHFLAVDTAVSSPLRLERYWHPERVPRARPAGDDEYAAEFLDLYGRAVKDRLRGGSVGLHLSGGLDSSSIAVHAARELRRQGKEAPPAFSWLPPCGDGPPGAVYGPEYTRIDQTAAREGLRVHHCQTLSPDDVVSYLRQDCTYHHIHWIEDRVQRQAANLGVRVLLSGLGGDEVVSFNGRGHYASLLLCGQWRRFAAECSARKENPIRVAAGIALRIGLEGFPYRRRRGGWFGRTSRYPGKRWLINPDFAQRVRPLPSSPPERVFLGIRRTQLRFLREGLLSRALEYFTLSGALYGIEYRFPLLDRRLLEFALGLPPEQFRRGRQDRWLMRYAHRSVLPSEVCWNQDKTDPSLAKSIRETYARAIPTLRQEVAARAKTASRAHYVDIPRLLDCLDADRFRVNPRSAPMDRALTFLDF